MQRSSIYRTSFNNAARLMKRQQQPQQTVLKRFISNEAPRFGASAARNTVQSKWIVGSASVVVATIGISSLFISGSPILADTEQNKEGKNPVSVSVAEGKVDSSKPPVVSGEPAEGSKETPEQQSEGQEQEQGQQAAYNPETGEINWDCPCLGGMAHGPCGEEFKEAFSCFIYSEAEPKGIDCIEKFKNMQNCFRKYPDVYSEELRDEEETSEEPAVVESITEDSKGNIVSDDVTVSQASTPELIEDTASEVAEVSKAA